MLLITQEGVSRENTLGTRVYALYRASKNDEASCPTIEGPTALELPRPTGKSRGISTVSTRMPGQRRQEKKRNCIGRISGLREPTPAPQRRSHGDLTLAIRRCTHTVHGCRSNERAWRNIPYTATMLPFPVGLVLASLTASFKSAMKVSTRGTVSLC